MALQMGALREALVSAGADEEKAALAAEEAATYETRLARIDAKLTVVLAVGGLLFAAVLGSQALMWTTLGKLDGQLAGISATLTHVEQQLAAR